MTMRVSTTPTFQTFGGNPEEAFGLWIKRVNNATRSKELGTALDSDEIKTRIDEGAIFLKIGARGENPFCRIQDCTTNTSAWGKLHTRYSGRWLTNKFGLLQTLFIIRKEKDKDNENHVSYLESKFARLQVMRTTSQGPLKAALLMSSSSNLAENQTFTKSINALPEHTTARDYATTLLIEDGKRMAQGKVKKQKVVSECVGVVDASRFNRDVTQFNPP